ncbi:MAG: serine hydrolase domain-containing protein [Ferruginibacter sp.]
MNLQLKTFILLIMSCLFLNSFAQKVQSKNSQPAIKKFKTNKVLEAKLDSIFSYYNKSTPGIAVTVLKQGKVIAKKVYGLASLEHKVPFTHSSVVRLPYSEGREFITIAAVLMEKDGILNFNDKVRTYFPKLPDWSGSVSIHDLINHTSGFIDEWDALLLTQASMGNRVDKSQFLELLYKQPTPEIEPGKGYMYSNSDYGLLRMIMEKASGEDLANYAWEKIFDPLGMTSTRFHNDKEEVIANRAFTYVSVGAGKYKVWMSDKISPGGNYHIVTTAEDLELWAAAHNDKNSTISKAARRLFQNATLIPGGAKDYTFGVKLIEDEGKIVTLHQGVNNFTYLSRDGEFAIITLGNSSQEYSQYHKQIRDYLQKKSSKNFVNKVFKKNDFKYTKDELKAFTGRYIDEDTVTFESFTKASKNETKFTILNDSLILQDENGEFHPLVYISKNVFKHPDHDAYLEFAPNPDGVKLNVHVYPQKSIYHLFKENVVLWQPNKKVLADFTGKYYSKHLDFYWTIIQDGNGDLIVKRPTIVDTKLLPEKEDEFMLRIEVYPKIKDRDASVRFHRDNKGNVTHFRVWTPRLMGHRFDKVQ